MSKRRKTRALATCFLSAACDFLTDWQLCVQKTLNLFKEVRGLGCEAAEQANMCVCVAIFLLNAGRAWHLFYILVMKTALWAYRAHCMGNEFLCCPRVHV